MHIPHVITLLFATHSMLVSTIQRALRSSPQRASDSVSADIGRLFGEPLPRNVG